MFPNPASESELTTTVDGKSDAELEGVAREIGVDTLLDGVFAGLCRRYRPERAKGERALIRWHLETPEGPRVRQLQLTPEV